MNKSELVAQIAENADLTKADAERALKATTEAITSALESGDSVTLVGFGTFSVAQRSAREGRNPQTGKKIKIAASKAPKFKAGKTFKDTIKASK